MAKLAGRSVCLSLPRRWIGELLHLSRQVPTVGGERVLRVGALATARRQSVKPPSWCALVIKGFAMAAARVPELRRSYLSRPWPRLFESAHSVASVVLDRVWRGEHATFMAPLLRPETLSLGEIDRQLRAWQTDEPEKHGPFRRLIRTAKLPWPLRRLVWSWSYHFSGSSRARYFGTFAISSLAAFRGRLLQVASPLTSMLYYDRVTAEGEMTIQLAFDHRVFDGYTAGRALSELESILNNEILHELKEFSCVRTAA